MRRFLSVFALKHPRHDKDPSPGPPSAAAPSLLKPLAIPHPSSTSSPALSPALSSASSSSPHLCSSGPSSSSGSSYGSASLSIQDSPSFLLTRSSTKRSWKSWGGKKRSGSLKHADRKDKAPVQLTIPDWDRMDLPVLLQPAFLASDDPAQQVGDVSLISAPSQSPSAPPSPAQGCASLSLAIKDSVARVPVQPSPFVQPLVGPIYPRSCNHPDVLRGASSLRSATLKEHLFRRLDDPAMLLDDPSILALASRPTPIPLSVPVLPDCDIPYPDKSLQILASSPGLHRWICRPCFEDRFAIYIATEAGVQSRTVSSSFAVAALEYSEALDVMVDPDYELVLDHVLPPSPPSPPVEVLSANVVESTPPPSIELSPAAALGPSRNSYIANPSPLRNQHTRAPSEVSPSLDSVATLQSPSTSHDAVPKKKAPMPSTAVKRVVRFAEDDEDEDDVIPLHLLRVKKKREEKAKFLRMEQQRRMREAFEAQKRLEAGAVERERKRVVMQKEKEERDRRLWAEQVAASRHRSEQSRAGAFSINSGSSSSLLVPHLRDGERNHPRASKAYSSKHGQTSSTRVDDNRSSSGSSRPPSLTYTPTSPNSPGNGSRPASTYSTTSSEDLRPSYNSRRNSLANSANGSLRSMAMPYPVLPMWTGSNQSLHAMQMVMVPNFSAFAPVNDMPLLPPNAPFMKQSRQSLPLQDPQPGRASSNERREPSRSSSTASLIYEKSHSPGHSRQSSAESRNMNRYSNGQSLRGSDTASLRQRPHPVASHSQPHPSRGRPPLPSFQSAPQIPSPWTALPSRTGNSPTSMPESSYSHPVPQGRNPRFAGTMGHDWRSTLIS